MVEFIDEWIIIWISKWGGVNLGRGGDDMVVVMFCGYWKLCSGDSGVCLWVDVRKWKEIELGL